jgi:hypothetical protein
MRAAFAVAAVALVILAVPAQAQRGWGVSLLPVVAHLPGVAPSFWQSDVFVHNPMDQSIKVGFAFYPENQANSLDVPYPAEHIRVIGPHQTLLLADVVYTMFGYGQSKGAMAIESGQDVFPENPNDAWFVAYARTYNTGSDPRGSFSQSVPSVFLQLNSSATPSFATGARHDTKFRCSLGIGNGSSVEITVHYRVLASDGSPVAEGARTVPSASIWQASFASLGIPPQEGPLSVVFWLDPASITPDPCADLKHVNSFFAYVSPVDGATAGAGTGDGEMIPALPTDFPPVYMSCG